MGHKKVCLECRVTLNRPFDSGSEQTYPCPECGKKSGSSWWHSWVDDYWNTDEYSSFNSGQTYYYSASLELGSDGSNRSIFINNDYINQSGIEIYPNPVHDWLTIRKLNLTNNIITISIYNITGNLTFNTRSEEQIVKINVSNLGAGIYIIEINDGKNITHQKIIKQ